MGEPMSYLVEVKSTVLLSWENLMSYLLQVEYSALLSQESLTMSEWNVQLLSTRRTPHLHL